MKFGEIVKRTYRNFAKNRIVASAFFKGYFIVQKIKNKECRKSFSKKLRYERRAEESKNDLKELRIATVCDDMTWQNLKQECQAYQITPNNWRTVFCEQQPDVFFCESAWVGIKEQGNCWHGKIYKNNRLLFENRKELLEILRFCKDNKIPTVFWNKEDPAFVDSETYDFKDTALKFDYIFTTAKECVEMYQKYGHNNVFVLPFGFSPYLFNPLNAYPKENVAVFAGSWYEEEHKRCKDLCNMFEKVLGNNVPLTIYDRQTGTTKEGRKFPKEYQPYVKPAVPFETLGEVLKKAKYAINVNTIQDSETMFARRVLEVMAMNTFVISNNSLGMQKLFAGTVCFPEDTLPNGNLTQACLKNLEYVFRYRTNKVLLTEAFCKVGVLQPAKPPQVTIVEINKQGEANIEDSDYVYLWDGTSLLPDFELMLPHFCYLQEDCGIRIVTENCFTIQETEVKENCLMEAELFRQLQQQPEQKMKLYMLGISTK